jgi:hypothetical protein
MAAILRLNMGGEREGGAPPGGREETLYVYTRQAITFAAHIHMYYTLTPSQ